MTPSPTHTNNDRFEDKASSTNPTRAASSNTLHALAPARSGPPSQQDQMSGNSIIVDSEISVTKAGLGNLKAGTFMVTEASWLKFVFLTKPPAEWSERKTEPATVGMITKERVPDAIIDRLKERPLFKKLPPISRFNNIYDKYPKHRDQYLSIMLRKNFCIDLHEDIVKQYNQKGFAEVGVDFTDGVKKLFILPQPQAPSPQVMMMQKGE